MIFSWRRKRDNRRGTQPHAAIQATPAELIIPNNFRCPISLDVMKDPVTLSTGITYDRENIEKWIDTGHITCPVTHQVLRTLEPIPNHTIRRMIQNWCVENRGHGVERIPTPRIPVSSDEAGKILEKILIARTPLECKELVGKVTRLMKESERNRKCIVGNGATRTLASTFDFFVDGEGETSISLLEDVMCGLTLMMPLDSEVEGHLNSTRSLTRLVWFLKRGDISGRINAILILKELITIPKCEAKVIETLLASEGAIEGLIKLIKEPISTSSTKASLVIIYNMIKSNCYDPSSQSMIVARFVDMGLSTLVLDILVDAEKSTCEKSLGVLDAICRFDTGRDSVYNNALTVPIVVKKILRISDLATEFSISILWQLCDNETNEGGGMVVEALQVGAFQKLLLILQVGCSIDETSKDKVTKLLKHLNMYRGNVECIESADFKDLKRSF